jgi:hypothetical protein
MHRRPIELRLYEVEKWRKARFDRAFECALQNPSQDSNQAALAKAAQLYTDVSVKANSIALASAATYRDFD